MDIADALLDATSTLNKALAKIAIAEPVTHVYNPLDYAREAHESYLAFASSAVKVILLGLVLE